MIITLSVARVVQLDYGERGHSTERRSVHPLLSPAALFACDIPGAGADPRPGRLPANRLASAGEKQGGRFRESSSKTRAEIFKAPPVGVSPRRALSPDQILVQLARE